MLIFSSYLGSSLAEKSGVKLFNLAMAMANVRQVVSDNADIIHFLLENIFASLTYDDKIFVTKLERPCPIMGNLVNVNSNSSNRKFCHMVSEMFMAFWKRDKK